MVGIRSEDLQEGLSNQARPSGLLLLGVAMGVTVTWVLCRRALPGPQPALGSDDNGAGPRGRCVLARCPPKPETLRPLRDAQVERDPWRLTKRASKEGGRSGSCRWI